MTIKAYRNRFIQELTPLYGAPEAESFFSIVLWELENKRRIDLALQPETIFSRSEISEWDEILEKLKKQIPIQYILGKTSFYGLEIMVNENVLIPRPETEELVAWVLSNQTGKSNLKILDIGTGSGCIAIALAKNLPDAEVFAVDVSDKALETAKANAKLNEANVAFIQKDILKAENLEPQFDIIVSNPPYVRNLEKQEIKSNVIDHEPHLALFVADDDALLFYRKIVQLALGNLHEKGELYLEINQYLAKETMDLLETAGFGFMELRQDIYGNDRMILARPK